MRPLPPTAVALLAAEPDELLVPLVEATGGELVSARREAVVVRPGRAATVRFAADVRRGERTAREGWVLQASDRPPDGVVLLEGPDGPVAAWRVRDDPSLPGLRRALDRDAVARLLEGLGLPADRLRLSLRAYRPQRRAVVEVTTAEHRLFVKCLRPARSTELHARHVALAEAGVPVPRSVGHDPGLGLVVLTPLLGDGLRDLLLRPGSALPPPGALTSLLDALARAPLTEKSRDPLRHVPGHAAVLRTVLPGETERVDHLLEQALAAGADTTTAVVHGDFYDGQLVVRDGELVGVVDVDGAGVGHPADDPANLLAHLLVLRQAAGADAGVHGWQPQVTAELAPRCDPDQLRRRTAAVLLGLATWPHSRSLPDWQPRTLALLDLTEQVLQGRT